MRFFRREIEIALKTLGVLALIALLTGPLAWGYAERQKARTWQAIACAYRLRDAERRTPILAGVDAMRDLRDPCERLERLGLELDLARGIEPVTTRWRGMDARAPRILKP